MKYPERGGRGEDSGRQVRDRWGITNERWAGKLGSAGAGEGVQHGGRGEGRDDWRGGGEPSAGNLNLDYET